MNYIEVTLSAHPGSIPYLEHILQLHMSGGWIEEDSPERKSLLFYLPTGEKSHELIERIRREIEKTADAALSTKTIEGEDWEQSWKVHFTQHRIGRFIIKPTWEPLKVPAAPNEFVLELDPGMAFGTGDHPTTSLCLELIERYVKKGYRVLDIGTGSGILTIASLYLGAGSAVAVDHDEIALEAARENLERLRLLSKVTLHEQDAMLVEERDFDVVAGNLFVGEIRKLLEAGCPPLKEGGIFIGSGIISEQRPEVESIISKSPFVIRAWRTLDIWDAFAVEKRKP